MKTLCIFAVAAMAATLPLAALDLARCSIEIVPAAPVYERYAAEELAGYLERITGRRPEIVSATGEGEVIRLGEAAGLTFSRTDEIAARTEGEDLLLLAGQGTRGTLYAVYALLEEIGVRFWSADHESVPGRPELRLDAIDWRYAPQFEFREVFCEVTHWNDVLAAKWRINGAGSRQPLPPEVGGALDMDRDHAFIGRFIKPALHFAAHPEWFAWNAATGERMQGQPCYSSDAMIEQAIREIRAEFAAHPGKRTVSLAAADNADFCQCEACDAAMRRYQTPGAALLLAVNRITRELAREIPELQVNFLSYWITQKPPVGLELEPGVAVFHAFLDRNHGKVPGAAPAHDPYLRQWLELAGGKVYVWDYYATFANFLLPTPNIDIIGPAFRSYADMGVKGVTVQLPFGSLGEFIELRCWLTAQLAWNPRRDSEALIDEYLAGHYGAAAPYLRQYFDLLSRARDRQEAWIGVYSEETGHWLTPADIAAGEECFRLALEAAAEETGDRRRVSGLYASLLMVEILRYEELAASGMILPPREAMIDELEEFGREFGCGSYKEWDDFGNLIRRLRQERRSAASAVVEGPLQVVFVPADLEVSNGSGGADTARLEVDRPGGGYAFLNPEKGSIRAVVPARYAGEWQVAVDLACEVAEASRDAAYVGIYAPHEIVRLAVAAPSGRLAEQVKLGRFFLPPGASVWVMPGVTGEVDAIEVEAVTLSRN